MPIKHLSIALDGTSKSISPNEAVKDFYKILSHKINSNHFL